MTTAYEEAVREATDYLAEADLHLARTGRLPSIPLPADLLRTLIAGPPEREGWVLVPREPTEEMTTAGVEAGVRAGYKGNPWCPEAYAAMLSAAPKP